MGNVERKASETNDYIRKLIECNPLREPVIPGAIKALRLPPGSKGLDAGCGIGLHIPLLLEAVGPEGHVTGLDLNPEFIKRAETIAAESGLSGQVSFKAGDIEKLPFENDAFDWLWSSDCAGYYVSQSANLMSELARVVRSGGIVAILSWSHQQLLPGYPFLEARLNTTAAGIAPFRRGMKPETHFLRALGWFRNAGLQEVKAQALTGSVHAPLSEDIRTALLSFLQMRWEGAHSEVDKKEWAEFQRLSDPESPNFILNLPDYYAFFTYSLFHGRVSA